MRYTLLALFATILFGCGSSPNQQVDYKTNPVLSTQDKQLIGSMYHDANTIAKIDQQLDPLIKELSEADAAYNKADEDRTVALNRIKAVESKMEALAVELGIKTNINKSMIPVGSLTKHQIAYVRPEDVIVLQDLTARILNATPCYNRPDAEHPVLIGYDEKGKLFILVPHTVQHPSWNEAKVLNAEVLKPDHQPLRLLTIDHFNFEQVK